MEASSTWEGPATVGTVQTMEGMLISGAVVILGDLDSSDDVALTDSDGRFSIDAFPSYSTLYALALRGDSVWHGEEPADGGPFDWTITVKPPSTPQDRVVLVRVLGPDGRPLPRGRAEAVEGAEAKPWRYRGGNERAVAIAGGWFPVSAKRWREGDCPVFIVGAARDDKGQSLPYGSTLVRVDPTGPPIVEVRLPFGTLVSGRVEFSNGDPAPATRIEVDHPLPEGFDTAHMMHPSPEKILTDATGHFSCGWDSQGEGTLIVRRVEGVHGGSEMVTVVSGRPEIVVRLRRETR